MNKEDTKICKKVIKILKKCFGADCDTSDLDDFSKMYKKGKLGKSVIHSGRCPSCRAKETINFLESLLED